MMKRNLKVRGKLHDLIEWKLEPPRLSTILRGPHQLISQVDSDNQSVTKRGRKHPKSFQTSHHLISASLESWMPTDLENISRTCPNYSWEHHLCPLARLAFRCFINIEFKNPSWRGPKKWSSHLAQTTPIQARQLYERSSNLMWEKSFLTITRFAMLNFTLDN